MEGSCGDGLCTEECCSITSRASLRMDPGSCVLGCGERRRLRHLLPDERDLNSYRRYPVSERFPLAQQRLVSPLGHLSPNGSLANLAALYPFDGLPDLHRHFKLTIILGLSEFGQSAFVA